MSIARLAAAGLLLSAGLGLPTSTGAKPGAGDDRAETVPAAIHEIQGDGLVSPLAGIGVVVEGIVTAKTIGGYFIQSPDDATDGLPATSEALFVQMEGLENQWVTVGDSVVVYGRVEEVSPDDDPHQLTVTRLVDVSSQFVITHGEPLPAPIELEAANFAPDSDPAALEHLEGMRVRAAELVVVGASQSYIRPDTQDVFPFGSFHALLGTSVAAQDLPFREPGLLPFDAGTPPAGKTLPVRSGSPQVLAVDGSAQRGSIHRELQVGLNDRVRDAVGVLDYRAARQTLLLDAQRPVVVEPGYRGEGAFFLSPGEVKLVWMDLGGLYDASDDPLRDEPVHAPAVYQARLAKIATGLCTFLANPEVIAVGGVENAQVLQDLAALVETNPTTYCPEPRQYEAVLVEGSDASGLDLGFLVAGYIVDGLNPRVQVLEAGTFAGADTSANPDGSSEPLFVRPPLAARLRLTDEGGRQAEFTAVNVQLADGTDASSITPGGAGWDTTGDRVMARRARQAARIAAWIEDRQQADADEAIAVLGGFEADPFNDGRVDVMGILTGRPAPAEETWVAVPSPVTTPLDNLTELAPAYTRYTANDGGEFRALDHILVNAPMRRRFAITSAHPRMNADFPASARAAGDPGFTFSSRDPLMARLAVAAFIDANTRVEIYSQGTFSPRVDNIFYVGVTNQGPDPAPSLELVIESSLAPAQWSLSTEWPGWTCGEVEAAAGGSRVACNNPRMIESHGFQIHVPADLSLDGGSATFTATLTGGHNDPDLSDNTSTRVFAFDGRVDLNVELSSIVANPELLPGESGGWVAIVRRSPLNPPGPVTITLDIDARPSEVGFNLVNGGTTCDAGVATGARQSRFTCTAVNDDFLDVAVFGVTFSTALDDGRRVIGLRAEARAAGVDPTPGDNIATASLRVSDRVDLVAFAPSISAEVASLEEDVSVLMGVANQITGVARHARAEILINLPPEAIGLVEPRAFSGPNPWTCAPPVAQGDGARVACTAPAVLEQPAFNTRDYYFLMRFRPPLRPGVASYPVSVSFSASSDSEEQVPGDNATQGSFVVDQTTDQRLYVSGPSGPVAEPGLAIFGLQVEDLGRNRPRNPSLRLQFNQVLAMQDIQFANQFGQPIACAADAAPAGATALVCPVTPTSPWPTVSVRTGPALAGRTLELQARASNDLVEATPTDNAATASVGIIALADLCFGTSCRWPSLPAPTKLEPDTANLVQYTLTNIGPSTARNVSAVVTADLPPAQLTALANGQACGPAENIGNGRSRLRCAFGDRLGDNAAQVLGIGLDTTGRIVGTVVFDVRLESDTPDPNPTNDGQSLVLPIVPLVDLSATVSAKSTKYPGPAIFSIATAAEGPATQALSRLSILIESPGANQFANLVMHDPGWSCGPIEYTTERQHWNCDRYLPIIPGQPDLIGVEVPAHSFQQIGRPIRVTATHSYPANAMAIDRTPGNNSNHAAHVVDGRSTQSVKGAPKPTPAYGVRRAPAPASSRAPALRAATR